MNPLLEYFENNDQRLIHKWVHYFDIYHRHFSRFIDRQPVVLEIGVYHGGSLQMWKDYFGDGAKIFGVDINPICKQVEEEGISIFIGDQADRNFLNELITQIGPIDILIDDGGHTMKQQITTFEVLFPTLKENGVYLVEDLHTSYWKERGNVKYGGGVRKRGTFIEFSKKLIDNLNAWHIADKRIQINDFTRSVQSITYYTSIVVFEKARIAKPNVQKTGQMSF